MSWKDEGAYLHRDLLVNGGIAINKETFPDAYVTAYRGNGDIILSIIDQWGEEQDIDLTYKQAVHLGKLLVRAGRLVEKGAKS